MATSRTDRQSGVIGQPGWKSPVRAHAASNITLSATQTIDGVAVVADDRVLVSGQTDQTENGIWVVASGAWTRAKDFNGAHDAVKGCTMLVLEGTTYGGTYWRLTTANVVDIGTDNLTFARAFANDDSLVEIQRTETGAQAHTLHKRAQAMWLNVVADFGAVGDGVTDDTAAIQAGLDALTSGAILYFPPTPNGLFYLVSSKLNLPVVNGWVLKGAGRRSSQVRQVTAATDLFDTNTTWAVGHNGSMIKDLWLAGANANAPRYGLNWIAGKRALIKNCRFSGFTGGAGIYTEDSLNVNVVDCEFDGNKDGIYENAGLNTGPNGWNIRGCMFENQTQYGMNLYQISGASIVGNTVQSCAKGGFLFTTAGGGLDISGNYFEANQTDAGVDEYFDINIGSNSYINGGSIKGNYFNGISSHTTDYYPVRTKFMRGWDISGNRLNTGSKFLKFANSAEIEGLHMGTLEYSTGGFSESDLIANIPTGFWQRRRNNKIDVQSFPLRRSTVHERTLSVVTEAFTAAVTGSGAVTDHNPGFYVDTGTTASSTAIASCQVAMERGLGQASIGYNNEIEFEAYVSNIATGTTNGKSWLRVSTAATAADPAAQGFGFRIDQNAIKGFVTTSAGTTTVTDLATSLSAGVLTHLRCVKQASAIYWYINGVEAGNNTTSAQLPSGDTTGNLVISATNGGDTSRQRLGIYHASMRVVPG